MIRIYMWKHCVKILTELSFQHSSAPYAIFRTGLWLSHELLGEPGCNNWNYYAIFNYAEPLFFILTYIKESHKINTFIS